MVGGTPPRGITLLVSLVALMAVSLWTMAMPPMLEPVHVSGSWQLDAAASDIEVGGFWLGIFHEAIGEQPDLAVAWSKDEGTFWPTWQIQIVGQRGEIKDSTGRLTTFEHWPGMESLRLATTMPPTPGHRYEIQFSYNPDNGALAVVITESVTGEQIAAGGAAASIHHSPFFLDTDLLQESWAEPMARATILEIQPGFVPWGLEWDVMVRDRVGEAFLPASNIERHQEAQLHMAVSYPLVGDLRVALAQGSQQWEIMQINLAEGTERALPLPIRDWPLGPVSIQLVYNDASSPGTVIAQKDVVVGRADTIFTPFVLDNDRQTVRTTLTLNGDGPLMKVPVNIRAQWIERVWDGDTRTYKERPGDSWVLFEDVVDIHDRENPFEIALAVPVPREPGFWHLRMLPEIESLASVRARPGETQVFAYPSAQIPKGEPYTIAVYPDVQYYSRSHPEILTRMNHWVAEIAAELNIGLLLQVGDVTNDNNVEQWSRAYDAFSLLNGIVPYVLTLGNHDMATGGGKVAERGLSLIQQFFAPTDFEAFVGSYPEGTLDNTFHEIRLGAEDYLIVALEYLPPDEALAWADEVISAHPHHRVLLVTHHYLNNDGQRPLKGRSSSYPIWSNPATTVNEGDEIWHKLLRKHENVFMALGGHIVETPAIPRKTSRGDKGNRVYQFLVNYQDEPNGGDGWFALVRFTPDQHVMFDVYSPYLGTYKGDTDRHGFVCHFTIDLTTGRIKDRLAPITLPHEEKPAA